MRSNCTRGRHSESAGVCVLIVCQHTIVCACRVLVNSVLLLLFMLYVRVFRSLEYHVCTSINVITINAHTGTYVCTYSTYVHNVYSMFCVCLHILLFFVVFCVFVYSSTESSGGSTSMRRVRWAVGFTLTQTPALISFGRRPWLPCRAR